MASLGRRRFLAASGAAAFAGAILPARAKAVAPRIIALDWGVAETLVALGRPPAGAAEIADYNRTVVAPTMPASVVDVGLRLAPNQELMQTLKADLVLINPAQEYMRDLLTPFGTVEAIPIYGPAGQPYRLSCEATTRLARMLGEPALGTALLTQAESTMAQIRTQLRFYDGRALYVVTFIDGRHVGVAGSKSLFQGVFDQLGLRNAWPGDGGEWGVSPIGIEGLAADRDARLLYLQPVPPEARRALRENPLWQRLPFVREGRVAALPPLWSFGALPSAMRIARQLGQALMPVSHD